MAIHEFNPRGREPLLRSGQQDAAFGYVTPHDKLAGNESAIWERRDKKLENAHARRRGSSIEPKKIAS